MRIGNRQLRVKFNSPVVLSFVGVCFLAQLLDIITAGASTDLLFSVYRSSLLNPLTYLRCVTHVFGHAGWDHLFGNMMYLLILGPMLEEKYGGRKLIFVMLATAVVTGIVNMLFFPHTALLGASGIVFAFILLSSITSTETGVIPLTFILVAVVYIGEQVYLGIFYRDAVSQLTHILGGIVGSVTGFMMNKKKRY